jgi:hypothetical protein
VKKREIRGGVRNSVQIVSRGWSGREINEEESMKGLEEERSGK